MCVCVCVCVLSLFWHSRQSGFLCVIERGRERGREGGREERADEVKERRTGAREAEGTEGL